MMLASRKNIRDSRYVQAREVVSVSKCSIDAHMVLEPRKSILDVLWSPRSSLLPLPLSGIWLIGLLGVVVHCERISLTSLTYRHDEHTTGSY